MINDEYEKLRCAIVHKTYRLLPEDYNPLLFLYKEQRELQIRLKLYEEHGCADKEFMEELRSKYYIAQRKFLHALETREKSNG